MHQKSLSLSLFIIIFVLFGHLDSFAQSAHTQQIGQPIQVTSPAPVQSINPLTGPSFPCPQPSDPLAQLVCSTPQLALLDMQFVQSYEALYQQVGAAGEPALRHEDFLFDLNVRKQCGISVSQGALGTTTPPPPAPTGSANCVVPLYQKQIEVWKSRLTGAALEEANRPIQQQVVLQKKLQSLGFLAAKSPIDGVYGTGTREAIIAWQNSIGRQPTGLLGNNDATALLSTGEQGAQTATVPVTPASTTSTSQKSVEAAWMPYTKYASCMLTNGFSLETFVHDKVLPTDMLASLVLSRCEKETQDKSVTNDQKTPGPETHIASSVKNNNSTYSSEEYQKACLAITELRQGTIENLIGEYDEDYNFFVGSLSDVIEPLLENGAITYNMNFTPPHTCEVTIIISGEYKGNSYQANIPIDIDPIAYKNDAYCQGTAKYDTSDFSPDEIAGEDALSCAAEKKVFLNQPDFFSASK